MLGTVEAVVRLAPELLAERELPGPRERSERSERSGPRPLLIRLSSAKATP